MIFQCSLTSVGLNAFVLDRHKKAVVNNASMTGSLIPSMGGFPVTHIWANSSNRTLLKIWNDYKGQYSFGTFFSWILLENCCWGGRKWKWDHRWSSDCWCTTLKKVLGRLKSVTERSDSSARRRRALTMSQEALVVVSVLVSRQSSL